MKMKTKLFRAAALVFLAILVLLPLIPWRHGPIRPVGEGVYRTESWDYGRLGSGESTVYELRLTDGLLRFKDESLVLPQFYQSSYEGAEALLAPLRDCVYIGMPWYREEGALYRLLGVDPAAWELPEGLELSYTNDDTLVYLYANEDRSVLMEDESLLSYSFRDREQRDSRGLSLRFRAGGQPITELPRNDFTDLRRAKQPARLDMTNLLSFRFGDLDSRVGGTALSIVTTDAETPQYRAFFSVGAVDCFLTAWGLSPEDLAPFLISVVTSTEGDPAALWADLLNHID